MRRLLPFALLAALFACGRVPTPEELAASTSTDLEEFWKEAVATARTTNTMQVRDELFTQLEGLQRYPSSSRPTIPDSSTSTEAFADFRTVATRVFTEGNVLRRGGTTIVFRVTGKDLCTPVRGTFGANSSCITNTDKLKVALRATAGTLGIDVTLLLNDELEIATVQILKGLSVSMTVDLANAQKASEFINATLGADSPFTRLTFLGEGKVEAKLRKWGPSDFEASLSFLSDVSGTVTDNLGFTRSGKSPRRSPLISLRVDGPGKSVSASLDVGASEYRGSWADFFDYRLKDPMTWALAGLTFKATAKDGGARSVTGISAGDGPSTLKFGDQTVVSFDLNANNKRRFDIEVSTGGGGLAAFTVRPGISSTLAFNLQPVANAGSRIDRELLNATYQHDLSSTDQAPKLELLRATQSISGGWKLTHGSISLSSPSGGAARVFNAVSCMRFRTSALTGNQNGFLDVFEPTPSCP